MCFIIIDANRYGNFIDPDNADMKPVKDWLDKGKGKIAYSPTKKMQSELDKCSKMKQLLANYRTSGKAKKFAKKIVEQKLACLLKNGKVTLESNDPHIIGLALAAKAKLLISSDKDLVKDFKNKKIVGGKIYSDKDNKDLLRKNWCS